MTPILQVESASAGYRRGTVVVSSVSMAVEAGTVNTVLGANGAGKTTLLRALAGQLVISSGSITFDGVDVSRMKTAARVGLGVALVPQGHQVFGGLSVLENLKMGAYRRRSAVDLGTSLEMVFDLFPVLRNRTGQEAASLSGGERAMLAVGRGLMSGPRLLLLDEPSLGLAPMVRKAMFETLAQISERMHMTIVMAEQDVALAVGVSDYAFVLQSGRIVREGPADDSLFTQADLRQAYLGV